MMPFGHIAIFAVCTAHNTHTPIQIQILWHTKQIPFEDPKDQRTNKMKIIYILNTKPFCIIISAKRSEWGCK